jgi:hypothetical protein
MRTIHELELENDSNNDFENDSNDSNDVFSDDSLSDVSIKKNVIKSVLKRVLKSVKSVRSTSPHSFVYLLNVRVAFEKDVIFETSLSHHVNFSIEKRFFLRSYTSEMTTKTRHHVNDKHLACHLVSLKTIVI